MRLLVVLAGCLQTISAKAGPWLNAGDAQVRSDVEILSASGLIDGVTTQWPMPWSGIVFRLNNANLQVQPDYLGAAAQRLLSGAQSIGPGTQSVSLRADVATAPALVRDFAATGRENEQVQAKYAWNGDTTTVQIAVGAQSHNRFDRQTLMLDDSYVSQKLGGAVVYGGYISNWWGPGQISALSISNNARPFPQIGISRIDTSGFNSVWLSWLGPWQADFFFGLLDGQRVATNTLLDGFHLSINPIEGLEIGVARTDELCGSGHPCKPLATYFDLRNDNSHPSRTNDEGNIDIKYSGTFFGLPSSVYLQLMNEDSSPLVHSGTSHLFGITSWLPVWDERVRLTGEFADSIATRDIFSFGEDIYGFAYHDGKYVDGMRYRGRTLGFSLDSDSRLATVQASWIGQAAETYSITLHHADIASPNAVGTNLLSATPVTVNIAEARLQYPFRGLVADFTVRVQDQQIPPNHGGTAAAEVGLRYTLQ